MKISKLHSSLIASGSLLVQAVNKVVSDAQTGEIDFTTYLQKTDASTTYYPKASDTIIANTQITKVFQNLICTIFLIKHFLL